MKKEELIRFLENTIAAIKADDSAEAFIHYEVGTDQDFNVSGFVRVGNSTGQGGSMMVNEKLRDMQDPETMPARTLSLKDSDQVLLVLKVDPANSYGEIVESHLHSPDGEKKEAIEYEAAIDGFESLVLALATAGFDIEDPKFTEAAVTAIESIGNHFGDDDSGERESNQAKTNSSCFRHTPTPWKVNAGKFSPTIEQVNGDGPLCIAIIPVQNERTLVDAYLIVAAVNSYGKHCGSRAYECAKGDLLGELLKSLQELAFWRLDSECVDGAKAKNAAESLANARRYARAAIANVKSEE